MRRRVARESWYERAAELSSDSAAKTRRLTLATEAGDLDQASALAAQGLSLAAPGARPAAPGHPDPPTVARLWQVQATVAFLRGDPGTAHRRLTEAGELIAAADQEHAAVLLIEAVHAAWYTGKRELAQSAARLERLDNSKRPLARLALRAVAPILGRSADGSDPGIALAEARLAAAGNAADQVLVSGLALLLGQDRAALETCGELSRDLRATGRIGLLPAVLFYAGSVQAYSGRHDQARVTVAEGLPLARDTGQQRWVDALAEPLALLAAASGDRALCQRLVDEALGRAADPAWGAPRQRPRPWRCSRPGPATSRSPGPRRSCTSAGRC